MRGAAQPIRRSASCPSSIVRRILPASNSQARLSGTCVLTWMTRIRSLASSIHDSRPPHNSAMYSVWPEKGAPFSATASLLSGAVVIASASPPRHISVAART
jgi:hypothetical protein